MKNDVGAWQGSAPQSIEKFLLVQVIGNIAVDQIVKLVGLG